MRRVSFAVLYHLLSVVFRPSCAVIRQDVGVRSSDVADLIFTQDLLWSTSSASLSACAVNCFTDDNCVSFTTSLADQNGQRECRGHSAVWMNTTGGLFAPGARHYRLKDRKEADGGTSLATTATTVTVDSTTTSTTAASTQGEATSTWLSSACSFNSQCPAANSECFSGQCLCTPGYYYSLGSDGCVSSCPKATLQDDFLQYPWRYITSNNLYSRYATFDVCKTECLNTPNCRSLDYKYSDNTCTGADVTPLQVPSDWRSSEGFSRVDYFQRMCA